MQELRGSDTNLIAPLHALLVHIVGPFPPEERTR
jgi:hypothetical protein